MYSTNLKILIPAHNKKVLRKKIDCLTLLNTGASFKTNITSKKMQFLILKIQLKTLLAYIKNNQGCSNISWSIMYKTICNHHQKLKMLTMCNLKRITIAESNREKSEHRTELTVLCPHFKLNIVRQNFCCLKFYSICSCFLVQFKRKLGYILSHMSLQSFVNIFMQFQKN